MEFNSEREAVSRLSEAICGASVNLFYATKYIFSLAQSDFYNAEVLEIFKACLSDITNPGAVRNSGAKINPKAWDILDSVGYARLPEIIAYSFAVRVPELSDVRFAKRKPLDDKQLQRIFEACVMKGAESNGIIKETFRENLKALKHKRQLEQYSAEWYKGYLLKFCREFSSVSNSSVFLMGAADLLFIMFYDKLFEHLREIIADCAIK